MFPSHFSAKINQPLCYQSQLCFFILRVILRFLYLIAFTDGALTFQVFFVLFNFSISVHIAFVFVLFGSYR